MEGAHRTRESDIIHFCVIAVETRQHARWEYLRQTCTGDLMKEDLYQLMSDTYIVNDIIAELAGRPMY